VDYFKSIIVCIAYYLVSIVDSMASQNPKDWEFSLAHLLDDLIQLFQLSTSRWHVQDETEAFERHVQSRSNLDPQQFPLISLNSLQPDVRALVIILEAKAMLVEGHHIVFEGCFQNTNESHMMSRLFDEIDHRLWFQGLLNHLSSER
jgi:hypothetical protein